MIVAITGNKPVFTAAKAEIFPEPLAASPILVKSFVQEYVVVPPVLPVANIAGAV